MRPDEVRAEDYAEKKPKPHAKSRAIPPVEIIEETDDWTAIAKPAGLSSISERWRPDARVVIDDLWKIWQRDDADVVRPHVVHRLDRETSGAMLFAKHADAQRHLREQFRVRTVAKTYFSLVRGTPSPEEGRITIQVEKSSSRNGAVEIVNKGKLCETDYAVVETFRGLSAVELRPKQGRTHQIRVSLASIGTPCAVDPLYGSGDPLMLSEWKRSYRPNRDGEERPLLDRLALHARAIEFDDPATGARRRIECEMPKDLLATLRQLRKWARR